MELAVLVTRTEKARLMSPELEFSMIVVELSKKLTAFILKNKDCIETEVFTPGMKTQRYVIHVFTTSQMHDLAVQMENKIREGVSIIL